MLNPPTRDLPALVLAFRTFAGHTEIFSPLYHLFCEHIAQDDEMLGLAAHTRIGQPPPNMFFAAAHYLLIGEPEHELAQFYPNLGGTQPPGPATYPLFRSFCLERSATISTLLSERITQTNEVRRCALLLPAFTMVQQLAGGAPLALLEIGPSAGLNLNFDHYAYDYGAGRIGLRDSTVCCATELRGSHHPPLPEHFPNVASRLGVDLNPIRHDDADGLRWLTALIWPEHTERFANLRAAIAIAQRYPPPLVAADALAVLPDLLAEQPVDVALCVYHTMVVYQFSPEQKAQLTAILHAASSTRPIYRLGCEGVSSHPEAWLTIYQQGQAEELFLATCSGHMNWIEWHYTSLSSR
jgi:hypothetical protein